jgi:hypothetical protein
VSGTDDSYVRDVCMYEARGTRHTERRIVCWNNRLSPMGVPFTFSVFGEGNLLLALLAVIPTLGLILKTIRDLLSI